MATASFVASTVVPIREPPLFIRNPNNKPSHFLIRHMPSFSKSLAIQQHHRRQPLTLIFCSSSVATPPFSPSLLSDSFRTLTSLVAVALSTSRRLFAASVAAVAVPVPSELAEIRSLQGGSTCSAGSLFFAALRDRPSGYLNTPLTVVASGMAKWLDIYSGVLMVRVLLSWFPNIPWDRQPLSAIRDLCDPYLNLFRNIIPPIFDTLDVSPLLAFAVLGTLGSILKSARGIY